MNVRFFGGSKKEYVSIPKHNPIGLYFCADTRELFLGDRLLSDGLRVVPTFADLPSISEHKVAEGIIYFIAETKNGYVLPHGGSEWLQVIYAPTTGEGTGVDLSGYYTKAEVDEAILRAIANIEVEVDLDDYALKSEIPSLEGYATEKYVDDAIAAQVPVKELAKKEEVIEVKTKLEAVEEEILPIVPIVPTIQELAEKAVTKAELQEAVEAISHPSELYIVNFNAPNYVEAIEAYNSGKLLLLANAAPDINSYAIMNYVSEKYITFTKFLMSRSSTYGAFNTYYLRPDNTWEVAKEARLNQVEANVEGEVKGELTSLRVGKEIYKLPDLANYVTNETLEQKEYVTNDYIEQKNYVTNQYITENYTTTQRLEETYVTNTEVTELVTNEVTTVVGDQIENKVTEVIEKKIEEGNLVVNADAINYDTW